LLFHDTHHRSVTRPDEMSAYDLGHYDGVLAFGEAVRDLYLDRGWAKRAWTWHEAADVSVFYPRTAPAESARADLVWIGTWGDGERSAELEEFLLGPVRALGIQAVVYGVRYPQDAIGRLAASGIEYRGWIPNAAVPDAFARFTATMHIPRRPYVESLPGVPTIRVFEALACGIPLVSARWYESADLFAPGEDFLVARDGDEMRTQLSRVLGDATLRRSLVARGRAAILERHTCGHRVDELLAICDAIPLELAVQ
jgi:spore maturation protein CgeB